jgi:hypothetical protein
MVHHITLFKLKPEVTPDKLEQMMMATRMTLLKIPEILAVKCGKAIDGTMEWPFFISLEFENMEKLQMTQDDAIYMKFVSDVIKSNTAERIVLNYEMEPGKNVKYS